VSLRLRFPPPGSGQLGAAQGNSGVTACHRGSGSHLPAQGNSGATQGSSRGAACHRGSGSHFPAQVSSEAGTCPMGSSTRLLAQDSSRGAASPRGSGLDENRQAKQLKKQSSGRFFLAPATRHRAAPGAPRVPAARAK
jgi:hypothetical protein